MRKSAVEFKHRQIFAGEVKGIVDVEVAAGTYKRGTLLATTDGKSWSPATAVALGGHYAVCGEDIELEEAGKVVAYRAGYFNKRLVEVNGAAASDDDAKILITKDIYLKETIEQ